MARILSMDRTLQEPGEGVGVVVESLVSKSLDSASMSGR
jgi:hypothetical protein